MTQEQLVLDRAKLCGQRLVDGFGPLVDSMPHGKPILTGFSHGTSGIALALARLARDTGDQETLDLSHRIFSYESSQYDALQGNWPDLRAPGRREFMTSWCHGAPGIALARLDALACDGEGDHRRQWQRAIASVLAAQDLGVDHLCCGNMGLVEVLLQSGRTLDRADLVAAAEARAARVVRRVRSRGAYRLFMGEREAVFNPGLFQGVAGIGYQLLRVSHPEALASVLSFHRTPACGAPAPTEPYLRRPPMVGEFHSSGELQRKVDSATECL
jgi:lantibiotic modifying enzyme